MSATRKRRLGLVGPRGDVGPVAPATLPGPIPVTRPIGAAVRISKEDLDTISEAHKPLSDALDALAETRFNYLQRERQLVAAVAKGQEKYNEIVGTVGKKLGVGTPELKEEWRFDPIKGTFTRTG
jgi:hypothetical protein